jgi:hypothetical protein
MKSITDRKTIWTRWVVAAAGLLAAFAAWKYRNVAKSNLATCANSIRLAYDNEWLRRHPIDYA